MSDAKPPDYAISLVACINPYLQIARWFDTGNHDIWWFEGIAGESRVSVRYTNHDIIVWFNNQPGFNTDLTTATFKRVKENLLIHLDKHLDKQRWTGYR